ncbi:hypothetical protein [Pleionea litopenaei]|uniref:Heavy-metal resistance protein n=1 Tax=Pleionea litopenaei TaxID=3070815 RepID=A0AA51RWF3_9GAMM|nr:hypothetical protein [Pleionea sp. HL-JVS1]WMS89031.1 hypothetical protein Q9312_08975 [Pleionea sp. HL-JVS1]
MKRLFVYPVLVYTVLVYLMLATFCSATLAEQTNYSGEELREIKSLSKDRIEGLLEGKGMGYAKVAELNGYPGPKHVLELAEELDLSEEQLAKTKSNFSKMNKQARELGQQLIHAERELETLFNVGSVTEAQVISRLENIVQLEAQLRACHVNAHLTQKNLLSAHQVQLYNRLRGYSNPSQHGKHKHHHE